MKTCKVCGTIKPIADYYVGVLSRCKECHKAAVTRNRRNNADKYLEYDRARAALPHRKELSRRVVLEWRAAHPDWMKAQTAVGNAIRDGKLARQPCWVCGLRAVAHHPDYSRPFDVVWLCQAHHKQAHALVA